MANETVDAIFKTIYASLPVGIHLFPPEDRRRQSNPLPTARVFFESIEFVQCILLGLLRRHDCTNPVGIVVMTASATNDDDGLTSVAVWRAGDE